MTLFTWFVGVLAAPITRGWFCLDFVILVAWIIVSFGSIVRLLLELQQLSFWASLVF
jgi:hypothetical protein